MLPAASLIRDVATGTSGCDDGSRGNRDTGTGSRQACERCTVVVDVGRSRRTFPAASGHGRFHRFGPLSPVKVRDRGVPASVIPEIAVGEAVPRRVLLHAPLFGRIAGIQLQPVRQAGGVSEQVVRR